MIARLLGAVLALFGSVAVLAADSCPIYRVNFAAITVPGEPADAGSGPAVCSAALALWNAWDDATTDRQGRGATYSGDGPGGGTDGCVGVETRNCTIATGACGAWNSTPNWAITFPGGTTACPVDACAVVAELSQGPLTGGLTESGSSWCLTDDGNGNTFSGSNGKGCAVERLGAGISTAGHWYGQYKYTGASCSSEATVEPVQAGNCVTKASGAQVCISRQETNCGTFNGERVCLDEVPPGTCTLLASGGAVCEETAETGPKDEEGEALAASVAVESVGESGDTITFNYYDNSVVSSSSGGVLGNANPSSSGEGGPRPAQDREDLPEFGQGLDDEWDEAAGMTSTLAKVQSSSWFGAMTSTASALGGSSTCPDVAMNIDFLDASFDLFEAACGYLEPHYGLWTTIMQIAWSLLAVRIFFGGGRD